MICSICDAVIASIRDYRVGSRRPRDGHCHARDAALHPSLSLTSCDWLLSRRPPPIARNAPKKCPANHSSLLSTPGRDWRSSWTDLQCKGATRRFSTGCGRLGSWLAAVVHVIHIARETVPGAPWTFLYCLSLVSSSLATSQCNAPQRVARENDERFAMSSAKDAT